MYFFLNDYDGSYYYVCQSERTYGEGTVSSLSPQFMMWIANHLFSLQLGVNISLYTVNQTPPPMEEVWKRGRMWYIDFYSLVLLGSDEVEVLGSVQLSLNFVSNSLDRQPVLFVTRRNKYPARFHEHLFSLLPYSILFWDICRSGGMAEGHASLPDFTGEGLFLEI